MVKVMFDVIFVGVLLRAKKVGHQISVSFEKFHVPGDQEGLFKLAVQLRKFFNSVITLQLDMFCWFI
jgi:hypothetical protein